MCLDIHLFVVTFHQFLAANTFNKQCHVESKLLAQWNCYDQTNKAVFVITGDPVCTPCTLGIEQRIIDDLMAMVVVNRWTTPLLLTI